MEIMVRMGLEGLIPVLVIDNADDAVSTAGAIHEGGLGAVEVTLRSDAGIQLISNIASHKPEMLVGAGTVLTLEKCKEAVANGASFVVSTGFVRDTVE